LRALPLKFFSNKVLDEIRKQSGIKNMSFYETFISMRHDKPWQNKNAKEFESIITGLMLQKSKFLNLPSLIDNIIKSFQLVRFIKEEYSSESEIEDRMESLVTLKSFIKGNSLDSFIDYVYMSETKKKKKDKSVKLMSIHSSKGLEFKHVFLIGVEDGKFPHNKSDLMEEARLFYVAATRPKENLYISEIGKGNQFIREYVG
jgi:DNA helicase-2/ATP-dependent DNA helicase PcrA